MRVMRLLCLHGTGLLFTSDLCMYVYFAVHRLPARPSISIVRAATSVVTSSTKTRTCVC